MTELQAATESVKRLKEAGFRVTLHQPDPEFMLESDYIIKAMYPKPNSYREGECCGRAFPTNKWRPSLILEHIDSFITQAKAMGIVS